MSIQAPPLPPMSMPASVSRLQAPSGEDALLTAARALEASFLAEMLKQTGLGKPPEGFGGGVGEDQFASHLAGIRAEQMVAAGGIGLAEQIFEDLKARVAQ